MKKNKSKLKYCVVFSILPEKQQVNCFPFDFHVSSWLLFITILAFYLNVLFVNQQREEGWNSN